MGAPLAYQDRIAAAGATEQPRLRIEPLEVSIGLRRHRARHY
jgi:hypothetical protein